MKPKKEVVSVGLAVSRLFSVDFSLIVILFLSLLTNHDLSMNTQEQPLMTLAPSVEMSIEEATVPTVIPTVEVIVDDSLGKQEPENVLSEESDESESETDSFADEQEVDETKNQESGAFESTGELDSDDLITGDVLKELVPEDQKSSSNGVEQEVVGEIVEEETPTLEEGFITLPIEGSNESLEGGNILQPNETVSEGIIALPDMVDEIRSDDGKSNTTSNETEGVIELPLEEENGSISNNINNTNNTNNPTIPTNESFFGNNANASLSNTTTYINQTNQTMNFTLPTLLPENHTNQTNQTLIVPGLPIPFNETADLDENELREKEDQTFEWEDNQSADVTIPLNFPPVISFIPDLVMLQGSSLSFDLTSFVSDEDGDVLEFSQAHDSNLIVVVENNTLRIEPVADFVGDSWFILIADDGENRTKSNNVSVSIQENKLNGSTIIVVEEKVTQLPAEIHKPVVWEKRVVLFNQHETRHSEIDLSQFVREGAFNVSKNGFENDTMLRALQAGSLSYLYHSDAPILTENETLEEKQWRKEAAISSDEHYYNIYSYVGIKESRKENVRLYFTINGTKVDITQDESYNVTYYDTNENGLIDKISWITPHLSTQYFEVVVDLTVINVQSYPVVGGNWEVNFNTTGTADLSIRGVEETVFGEDLDFLELKCGDEVMPTLYFNNTITAQNYSCDEVGVEISRVLTKGKHDLEFRFGDDVEYAHNDAGAKVPITTYQNRSHVINSFNTSVIPTIDGDPCTDAACASSTEWNDSLSNARSIVDVDDDLEGDMQVRVKHDANYLYVFVDFITDSSDQDNDYVNVVIDTANTGGSAPTANHWRFEASGGSNAKKTRKVFRGNGSAWVENTSFTQDASRWNVDHGNGASPVESSNHLTFEFRINMTAIDSDVNETVGFMVHGYGTPTADGNTYWPPIAVESDENDYDVPGFNYSTTDGSSSDAINALPDTWGNLVPDMSVPDNYGATVVEGNMTILEIHHTRYGDEYVLRIVGNITENGTASKTAISRDVADSDKDGGALHNKTTELFVGDHIDLYTKDSERILKPFLFINRIMFMYNKSDGVQYNLTPSTANSSSCFFTDNSSDLNVVKCIWENDDVQLSGRYLARTDNTHMIMFFTAQNVGAENITVITLYNYFDYDITKVAGSETQDDFYAIIQHTDNSTVSEQVNKEGKVVCDATGAPNEIDLTKCDAAVNDSFFLRQSLGSGEAGGVLFATEATKFVPTSVLSTFIGFTNPSTDTDGEREVPSQLMDVSHTGLMNKADLAAAIQIIGSTLEPNQKFEKYFALSTSTTEEALVDSVNEAVPGVPVGIQSGSPLIVRNGTTTPAVTQVGAYDPINSITEVGNVGFVTVEINHTCNVTAPNGDIILSGSYVYSISPTEPIVNAYCGGVNQTDVYAFNVNNSLSPGVYTATTNVFVLDDIAREDTESGNFTILTDYVGDLTLSLNQTLLECNETLNITVNVTNRGNQNFTGNLSIDLYYSDPLTYNTSLFDQSIFVPKNGENVTTISKTVTECPFNRTYTVQANFTVSDETNSTEVKTGLQNYTFHLWSYNHGTVRGNLTLPDTEDNLQYHWTVANYTGNVFVADADSVISWFDLQALGIKNDSVTASSSDFSEADSVLLITETRDDGIADMFSLDGTSARNSSTIKVFGRTLNSVSLVNSSSLDTFKTGILWDASDSTNDEFDSTDQEDLVFIAEINFNETGEFGVYDYELRVPDRLNGYKGATEQVSLYAELK